MTDLLLDLGHYAFNPYAVPLAVTGLAALTLAFVVFARHGTTLVGRALTRLVLVATAYCLALAARYSAADETTALLWARLTYVPIAFLPPAIYAFVMRLLGRYPSRGPAIQAGWVVAFLFAVLALGTDELVVGLRHYAWGPYDRLGLLVLPFLLFFVGLLADGLLELRKAYLRETLDAEHRRRLGSFAALLLVASLALVDYLPAFGVAVYPFGYLAILAFIVGAARTVDRYDLIDITPAFAADEILATVPDPLLVCDGHGRIQVSNAAATAILGYTPEELHGRGLRSLFPDRENEAEAMSVLEGRARSREVVVRSRDGAEIMVNMSASPLSDGSGAPVGTVVLARDIRQRKRLEAALRESERHFRSLIENGSDLITVLTEDLLIRYESPSVERILGYTPEDRIGRPFLDEVHEEDQDRLRTLLERVRAEPGTTITAEYRTHQRRDGERVLEGRVRNLLEEPAVAGIVVNSRNVTRQHRMEAELRQHQRLESVSRLAGGVAHDFNNLLTTIQGHLFILEEDETLSDEARSELREVRRGADRVAELTSQLMAFSRQQVHRPALVDLNALVEEVRPYLQRLLGTAMQLEADVAPEPITVRADPDRVRQVLVDLVLNARDAMPDGGRITMSTGVEHLRSRPGEEDDGDAPDPGDYAVLRVSDTGVGMDEDTRRRIFEPFFTTKKQGKGTGLGLSTAYGIVRQSGGTIDVETEPGRGSTFRILLPRIEAATIPEDDVSPA